MGGFVHPCRPIICMAIIDVIKFAEDVFHHFYLSSKIGAPSPFAFSLFVFVLQWMKRWGWVFSHVRHFHLPFYVKGTATFLFGWNMIPRSQMSKSCV